MSTNDKSVTPLASADAEEQRDSKRPYRKPMISDFSQAAVAFGSPTDFYTCSK